MAFVAQSILSDSLAKGHIGQLNISLDSWTDTVIPSITAGSWAQVAGTIYYATGDTTIDGDGVLAAGANSTLYYYHIDSVDLDVICTSSAPTWLDDKAEWGQTLGGHYCRCLGSVWKNSGGTYEQKSIWYGRDFGILASGLTVAIGANADRTIRLATDCRILWDESEDEINIDKDINITGNINVTGDYYVDGIIKSKIAGSLQGEFVSQNTIFDLLDPSIPNTNDTIVVTGANTNIAISYTFSHAKRIDSSTIYLYYAYQTASSGGYGYYTLVNGSATSVGRYISMAW